VADAIVEIADLRKTYKGVEALAGLNLRVPRGAICGLLGRNGAGKTTALKTLLGMVRPTSGTIRAHGLAADVPEQSLEIRRRTSFVSEDRDLYSSMSVAGIVGFASGVYPRWRADLAAGYLRKLELPADRAVKHLSRGMRTKLAWLLALSAGTELVILDEPTAGLDPVAT
jgi:ABC-2 type transport system ATP-binding protein